MCLEAIAAQCVSRLLMSRGGRGAALCCWTMPLVLPQPSGGETGPPLLLCQPCPGAALPFHPSPLLHHSRAQSQSQYFCPFPWLCLAGFMALGPQGQPLQAGGAGAPVPLCWGETLSSPFPSAPKEVAGPSLAATLCPSWSPEPLGTSLLPPPRGPRVQNGCDGRGCTAGPGRSLPTGIPGALCPPAPPAARAEPLSCLRPAPSRVPGCSGGRRRASPPPGTGRGRGSRRGPAARSRSDLFRQERPRPGEPPGSREGRSRYRLGSAVPAGWRMLRDRRGAVRPVGGKSKT